MESSITFSNPNGYFMILQNVIFQDFSMFVLFRTNSSSCLGSNLRFADTLVSSFA